MQHLAGLESHRTIYCFVENLSLERIVTGFVFKAFKHLLIIFPICFLYRSVYLRDFPGGAVVKNPPTSVGDVGSVPALE